MSNEKDQGVEQALPLTTHLEELRKVLIRVFAIVIIVFCFVYWKSYIFMDFVTAPIVPIMPEDSSMAILKLTEGFFTELKLSALVAVFFSMPFIFYQLWKFIAPGLYAQEKKYVFSFVVMSSLLFFLGASFAYYVVFPFGFKFFLGYAEGYVTANLSIQWYLSFVTRLIMAFGLVFEMPVFVLFLSKMGIVSAEMMRKHRRYAYFGIVVFSAVLTPPDVFTQLMMSGPMILLYEFSVIVAKIFGRKREINEEDVYE
ncbi:MAG: twin-arginine translocase subunit TatC [Denitrovibrio sp.]|nr:MAG: twin-arginine translocase subunit TatC [Denitrovibrio sp.]